MQDLNSLLKQYRDLNSTPELYKIYSGTGEKDLGKIFSFQNTNYRTILSFIKNYETFMNGADSVERTLWERNDSHGQEQLKQHTVRMLKSKLFSKNENTYYHTRKGEALSNIPDEFTNEEKWIIVFLLLLDSYFSDVPNYIVERSREILEDMSVYVQDHSQMMKILRSFIVRAPDRKIVDLFFEDYFYLDSFYLPYKGFDIAASYFAANEEDRSELANYICFNREMGNYDIDCLAKKYENNGSGSLRSILDNAKILYISDYLISAGQVSFEDFIKKIVDRYDSVVNINKGRVLHYIFADYKDIFYLIYMNVINPDYLDSVDAVSSEDAEEDNLLNNINKTVLIENVEETRRVSSVLKRKAIERADYKCALEDLCNCSPHYFTNKKTGKNYMELHHFIPREFGNDFEHTIEQIENYVSLCPRCHRFIHNAVDRERLIALTFLYNKLCGGLDMKKIGVSLDKIKRYYHISEE